jgi:hypothetical protein
MNILKELSAKNDFYQKFVIFLLNLKLEKMKYEKK